MTGAPQAIRWALSAHASYQTIPETRVVPGTRVVPETRVLI